MVKGQALLVVLLVMGVVMTVGLSVVSRSITEVNISTTEDQSAKALQAAEAGVEQSLGGALPGTAIVGAGTNNASFNTVKSNLGGSSLPYQVPYLLDAGDVATIVLDGTLHSLVICGGKTGTAGLGIEVMLYYTVSGSWYVGRNAYGNLSGADNFNNNSCTLPDGKVAAFRVRPNFYNMTGTAVPPTVTTKYLRIRMLNNIEPQPLAVSPSVGNLAVQGSQVASVGTSGDTAQKIVASDPMADLPFMFDAALYSGGEITQSN